MLGVPHFSDHELRQKREVFGVNFAQELSSIGGTPFLVEDGAGSPAIALVGDSGLAITTLDDENEIMIRVLGRLTDATVTSSRPAGDGDLQTPYKVTIEHPALPSGRIVRAPQSHGDLAKARHVFSDVFGP